MEEVPASTSGLAERKQWSALIATPFSNYGADDGANAGCHRHPPQKVTRIVGVKIAAPPVYGELCC
jgi:hypothetical protein